MTCPFCSRPRSDHKIVKAPFGDIAVCEHAPSDRLWAVSCDIPLVRDLDAIEGQCRRDIEVGRFWSTIAPADVLALVREIRELREDAHERDQLALERSDR